MGDNNAAHLTGEPIEQTNTSKINSRDLSNQNQLRQEDRDDRRSPLGDRSQEVQLASPAPPARAHTIGDSMRANDDDDDDDD